MLTISKSFTFEASHVLPRHPGKCARLHGHSWKLTVSVTGPVNPETGFVLDYKELSDMINIQIISGLDHRHLGQGIAQLPGGLVYPPFEEDFYPSSENLVVRIAGIFGPLLKNRFPPDISLSEVRLAETCTCEAIWRP
jgi:queuosine biosynthesis protein QueD